MPHHYSDPGIPTLTQRAEPTLGSTQPAPAEQARPQPQVPVLTQVTDTPSSALPSDAAGGADAAHAAWSAAAAAGTATAGADAVLRSALQAELEQALQHAIDDAAAGLRARLEAELPALIERAVRAVRPG
ncbi:hypothetical protein [Bordetella petrii]|uniref:hypothetical protein n=1 Tax=Bordetella petrii TaxID=94624 RepID=UPI000478F315|nr:hypothetical protein [Bordetella petrii]